MSTSEIEASSTPEVETSTPEVETSSTPEVSCAALRLFDS